MDGFKEATTLLLHYFQACYAASGMTFGADNKTEVEAIIDNLEDGVCERLEELKQEIKREIEDDLQLKFNRHP